MINRSFTKPTGRLGKALVIFSAILTALLLSAFQIAPFTTTEDEAMVVDLALYAIIALSVIVVATSVLFAIFVFRERKAEKKIAIEIADAAGKKKKKKAAQEEDDGEKFPILSRIDRAWRDAPQETFASPTLPEICLAFRNYAASTLKLYYTLDDIRSFIAGLGTSRLLIMQGISGTGKTSLAYAWGRFLGSPSAVIPVQPMWKESSDILGYFNEFTNRFNETNLLISLYRAQYTGSMCVTVLDEMNIARIEYYFAEFLSLMELPRSEDRKIRIATGSSAGGPEKLLDGQLHLPDNMWFIGTANNDDSTFAISDKVYDRAMIVNLDSKAEAFSAPATAEMRISGSHFDRLSAEAEQRIQLSAANFEKLRALDGYLQDNLQISFGNRVMRQILKYTSLYVACGGTEADAIDDILCKKVLRKLEAQNPIYVAAAVAELLGTMDKLFGPQGLPRCRKYLSRFRTNR